VCDLQQAQSLPTTRGEIGRLFCTCWQPKIAIGGSEVPRSGTFGPRTGMHERWAMRALIIEDGDTTTA
jgi:hypothetical protein